VPLQDNTVSGCVAGLWYMVTDQGIPQSPADGTAIYYPAVLFFEEYLLLVLLLALSVPPRASPVLGVVADTGADLAIIADAEAADLALFVLGNQVDPGGSRNVAAGATSALLLALNGQQLTTLDTIADLSVIVSGNQLRGACGPSAPAALLTLPAAQPCAITGNVILNLGSGGGQRAYENRQVFGPSLWLIVAESGQDTGTALLSVTGNVLFNQSDLLALIRDGSSPPSGWFAFNANPT